VAPAQGVHVFDYVDYRQFLRDFYAAQKTRSVAFSHRAFSRRAGLKSSNYLSLVMKGERHLSSEMATRFAKACGLGKREASFFCDLVAFGQAKTTDEKQRWHEQLARYGRFREAHRLVSEQAAYYQHWYMPALRELVTLPSFREDAEWIAAALEPSIGPKQAKKALATLIRLGLLVRDDAGKLRQAQPLVTTGPGPLGHHVFAYHHGMIDLGKRALEQLPRDQRDITSLTLCISASTFPLLKQHVRELRQELLELAAAETSPEQVVQLNFQMFPLSRAPAAAAPSARSPRTSRKRGKT
jgi:uncharacterized protein (TIGR02147 family)